MPWEKFWVESVLSDESDYQLHVCYVENHSIFAAALTVTTEAVDG